MEHRFPPRYRSLRPVGHGGMGVVYEAWDEALQRRVAIKVIGRDKMTSPEAHQRFKREVRALARLHHRSVVEIFDFEDGPELTYFTMELLDGLALRDLIDDGGLGLATGLEYLGRVVDGVAAIHAARLVHRDIKPDNVVVTASGEVKLIDFGLAKGRETDADVTQLTRTGQVVGTLPYLPPEVMRGVDASATSDVYQLGLLAYELLTAAHPVTPLHMLAFYNGQPGVPFVRLAERLPGCPPELDELVMQCLAREPVDRPADAAAVGRRLAEIGDGSDGRTEQVAAVDALSGASAKTPTTAGRRRRVLGMVVLGGLVVACYLGLTSQFEYRVDELAVPHVAGTEAMVTWRSSWRAAAPRLVIRGADGEAEVPCRIRTEYDEAHQAGFRYGCVVEGLTPNTRYTVALQKPDGSTTFPRPFKTSHSVAVVPTVLIGLPGDGTVVVSLTAPVAFTVAARPPPALCSPAEAATGGYTTHCVCRWPVRAGPDELVVRSFTGVVHREGGPVEAIVARALDERIRWFRRACDDDTFYRLWHEPDGGVMPLFKAAGDPWPAVEEFLTRNWPSHRVSLELLRGLSDVPGTTELACKAAMARLPFTMFDRAAELNGRRPNPRWPAATVSVGSPQPLVARPTVAAAFVLKGVQSGLPFQLLGDWHDENWRYAVGDDPLVRDECSVKRLELDLGTNDPTTCTTGELELLIRLPSGGTATIVDVNDGRFLAAFPVQTVDYRRAEEQVARNVKFFGPYVASIFDRGKLSTFPRLAAYVERMAEIDEVGDVVYRHSLPPSCLH